MDKLAGYWYAVNMKTTAKQPDADDIQHARAAHMRDLFEPWTYRKLAARTGLGRSSLQSKFTGTVAFTLGDIEILAPIIRMTPAQLATELFEITGDSKSGATANVTPLNANRNGDEPPTSTVEYGRLAPILPFRRPAQKSA